MHISLPPSQDPQLDEPEQPPANRVTLDPLLPVTLPVIPPANQTTDEQQAHLIRELGNLNVQIGDLMQEQPSLESMYQQHLAAAFPDLSHPIDPNQIFYNRYREDSEGRKQHLSSDPLGSLLSKLRAPGSEDYLTQEAGAFYRQADTLEADKRLSLIGSAATLTSVLTIAFTKNLNEFWTTPFNDQPSPEKRLVALRRQALAHQLALHTVDGTLSAAGRTLADNVLKYPTAVARQKAFAAGRRPGVYRLALEDGSGFCAAFIMSATGQTPFTGNVLLYSPGEGFEEYDDLARLNEAVAARMGKGESAGKLLVDSLPTSARAEPNGLPVLAENPPVIEADVVATGVHSLRVRQYFNVRDALLKATLPAEGELDLAADLTPQLDICAALAVRNLRLVELREPHWLRTTSAQDQSEYKRLETAMVDSNSELIPLLENISTQPSFSADETEKTLKLQKPAYADVDIAHYKSLVHLRVTSSLPVKVTGYRNERTGTVFICKDPKIDILQYLDGESLTKGSWSTHAIVVLQTLGSYARRNVEPLSLHQVHRTTIATADIIDTSGKKHGRLDNADLHALAQQADIGKKYQEYLKTAFSQSGEGANFAAAWQRANAAKMQKDALESRLNPAAYNLFTFKIPGSGLDWIKVVIEHPDSTARPLVGRYDIEANLLVLGSALEGGQVINGVTVIQRKGTRANGVSVLYAPDAPDGIPFRELVTGLAELDSLKVKPEWQAYFTQRMATNDTEELAQILSDTRSVHRYTLIPITGNFHAFLYSAQLGFQLAHADFRSRSNAEVARESSVNAFMFGVEVADFLMDLLPGKTALSFLRRGIIKGLNNAKKLGHRIPGLIKKTSWDNKASIAIGKTSIRPLEPAWINVVEYRLPPPIDPLFDVEAFAQTNNFKLSRKTGAPSFIDNKNNQFIAMRHENGRYHLYQSYMESGARYVKDPAGNKVDFMVVPGDAKSWKARSERTAIGGGPVMSALGPRTAGQQLDDDLLAVFHLHSTEAEMKELVDPLKELDILQKQQLLDNARRKLGVNEAEFRRMLSSPRGLSERTKVQLRNTILSLRSDADTHFHINRSTRFLTPSLSAPEKDQLYRKIVRIIGKNDDFSKQIRSSIRITDPDTKAEFVGYAITKKQENNLDKFSLKHKLETFPTDSLNAFITEKGRQRVLNKIASDHKITREEALELLLSDPQIQESFRNFKRDRFKDNLKKLGIESYSEDFKKSGIPYIALSYGKQTGTDSGIKMVDSVTVTAFEKNISQFSTPLEFSPSRAQTHKIEKPSSSPGAPAVSVPTTTRDPVINIVKSDDLADTQVPLLPDGARTKLEEIIQDIQAGRISRKKIGNFTYVDLPQVETGSGRGKWRAAFEQTGKEDGKDVFILRGIIDYHGSTPKAWGM
ncbi:hypothetical protein GIR22_06810 [Pseudomonas sp. CCM 7891]|uniref:Dermonecrotic toxin N-terminal domain-containing protein n=1 Tax=Pseudomonas karstica TaxID=1055468 RepID=A0A7X2RTD2_9PSED|nr:DUF6543 domain-containing protein [Pseudomonas karstica]MTD18860.1 hypothetical protein [Pseudomonas karstica]